MKIPPRREGDSIVVSRSYSATIGQVWAALTVSDELARWYGTYTGDPDSGVVQVTMTEEGTTEELPMRIDACEPERRLALSSDFGGMSIALDIRLHEGKDATVVELAQRILTPEAMGEWGPGWEYYLDRLGAALGGGNPDDITFESYFPSLAEKYRDLAS